LILKFGSAKILHTRVNDKRIEPPLPHCTGLDNAIIVNNKDLNADFIPEYSNDHITTAHLWWLHGHTRKELIIANIYFRPRAELEPDVELLKELVRDRQWSAIPIIISGDWNSRHPSWDDGARIDHLSRGQLIFDLMDEEELHLANFQDCGPTFYKRVNNTDYQSVKIGRASCRERVKIAEAAGQYK